MDLEHGPQSRELHSWGGGESMLARAPSRLSARLYCFSHDALAGKLTSQAGAERRPAHLSVSAPLAPPVSFASPSIMSVLLATKRLPCSLRCWVRRFKGMLQAFSEIGLNKCGTVT